MGKEKGGEDKVTGGKGGRERWRKRQREIERAIERNI